MKLYKGSIYPINVKFAPCYCDDSVAVSDLTLNFYTTDPEHSVEFSGDSITVSGLVATVVFQPAQLDALEDGVLRFISEFNYSGNPETWACATDKYLLTPPNYEPIDFVTTDTVEEVVSEAVSAELKNRKYVLNHMTTEEKVALYNELIQYADESTGFVKYNFPIENYRFYCYQIRGSVIEASQGFHNLNFLGFGIISEEKVLKFRGVPFVSQGSLVVEMQAYLGPEGRFDFGYLASHVVQSLNGQHGFLELKSINGNDLIGSGDIEITATLPVASSETLGGVKIGEGISVDENGVISVSDNT